MFLLPSAMMGIGNAGMWGPLATTATRNLPMRQAGAGSGIYNTTRTVGSVIGSAAIAAFMQNRLEANLPGASEAAGGFGGGTLPAFVIDGFSIAMAQAILLPACVLLIGARRGAASCVAQARRLGRRVARGQGRVKRPCEQAGWSNAVDGSDGIGTLSRLRAHASSLMPGLSVATLLASWLHRASR